MGALAEGHRPVAQPVDTVLSRIMHRMGGDERQPRYRAEGRLIVSHHTNRRQTPPVARQALGFLVDSALSVRDPDLAECDMLMIVDLIRAIREAERNDPTPPAAIQSIAA